MGAVCSCFTEGNLAAEGMPTMAAKPVKAAVEAPSMKKKPSVHRYAPAAMVDENESAARKAANRRKAADAIFTICDRNGDDMVSKRELKTAIKAQGPDFAHRLGLKHGVRDVESWFHAADTDGNHMLDRNEFFKMLEKQYGQI